MAINIEVLAEAIGNLDNCEQKFEHINGIYASYFKAFDLDCVKKKDPKGLRDVVKIHAEAAMEARIALDMVVICQKILAQGLAEEEGRIRELIENRKNKADVISASVVAMRHNLRVTEDQILKSISSLKKEVIENRILRVLEYRNVHDFVKYDQIRNFIAQDHQQIEEALADWKQRTGSGPVLMVPGRTCDAELYVGLNNLIKAKKIRKKTFRNEYQLIR
jgi:cysteinyl-tRNA synthetase